MNIQNILITMIVSILTSILTVKITVKYEFAQKRKENLYNLLNSINKSIQDRNELSVDDINKLKNGNFDFIDKLRRKNFLKLIENYNGKLKNYIKFLNFKLNEVFNDYISKEDLTDLLNCLIKNKCKSINNNKIRNILNNIEVTDIDITVEKIEIEDIIELIKSNKTKINEFENSLNDCSNLLTKKLNKLMAKYTIY